MTCMLVGYTLQLNDKGHQTSKEARFPSEFYDRVVF